MSTALVPAGAAGGFLAVAQDDLAALEAFTSDMNVGGGIFLKHDGNHGYWTYGSAQDELADGTQLAFNPMSVRRGYICWKDEKVVDEKMKSFRDGAPIREGELPDYGPYGDGDGWVEQMEVEFRMTEAPFLTLTFKGSGKSKVNALARLIRDYSTGYKINFGKTPIVEIGNNEFQSKAKGARGATKFAPTLKIIDWVDPAELDALVEGSAADYEGGDEGGDAPEELEAAPEAPAPAARQRPAQAAPAAPAKPAARPARTEAAAAPAARRGRFG